MQEAEKKKLVNVLSLPMATTTAVAKQKLKVDHQQHKLQEQQNKQQQEKNLQQFQQLQQLQQQQQLHMQIQQQQEQQHHSQKSLTFAENRTISRDSISLNSPPATRSLSAPLPMSKAARKAFLAAKQTKAIEKLDKMIEEVTEEQQIKATHSMRISNVYGQQSGNSADDIDMGGGCPLFLPPPPTRHIANSISDSNICSHG